MSKLSVAIITFNEEKNIRRCLESVKDIADEIVVVDSYSTDKTEEICRNYDVIFIKHEFEGYIEQKNYAVKHTSFPYILALDADEALSDKLKESIISEKENWQYDAYSMNRLTNYCGKWIKHGGWYPDRKLRIFQRDSGKWGGTNPHDQFILLPDKTMKFIQGDILHYSYYGLEDHLNQIEHFTDVSSRAFFEMGRKAGFIKLYLSPVGKFIKDYLVKRGFLDGKAGFTICRLSARATYIKYRKIRKLYAEKKA